MTFQEVKYLTSFATTAITAAAYAARVQTLQAQGYFSGPDADLLTGRALLILVAAIVIAGILGQIVVTIIATILGTKAEYDEDERDRQIDFRAMTLAFTVVGFGLLAALILLATGATPFLAFHVLVFGMVAAGLTADLWRIFLYRRGF